jgi:hypothetical protein
VGEFGPLALKALSKRFRHEWDRISDTGRPGGNAVKHQRD